MVQLSVEEIRAIAQELLVSDKTEARVHELLEEGNASLARISLLGALDAIVDDGRLAPHVAESYYKRLGFTKEEMSGFRQYRAQRDYMEGNDLLKKLS